jgi:hypothetical protein
MPDPSLWRPYVPIPVPRIFLLYVPHPRTHREAGICPEWMEWGETLGIKDTFLPFMTILRAGPDPRALERLQFYHLEQ